MHRVFEGIELSPQPWDYMLFVKFKGESYSNQSDLQFRQGNIPQAVYCMALASYCAAVWVEGNTTKRTSDRAYIYFLEAAKTTRLSSNQWREALAFISTDHDMVNWIPELVNGGFQRDVGI